MATRTTSTPTSRTTRWHTIDLMTAALMGVVFGVAYWGWSTAYEVLGIGNLAGSVQGLFGGPWLIAGVVAGLVVRRPGAALFAELIAASVEALLGNAWGWSTLLSGGLQGLGVELALAVFLYKRFGWPVAALGGALSALFEFGYELHAYWAGYQTDFKVHYMAGFMLSGAVVAGMGGWILTRALAATGAIDALPAGRDAATRAAR